MLPSGLKLEQAPPISVPFRFFLTAPLFLFAAAAVLMWLGPEVFESRMSAGALVVTHLFSLGFMTMIMLGAMMQVLPVVAGAPVPWPRATAAFAHIGLVLGTLALALGFYSGDEIFFRAAVVLLGIAFAVFVAAAAWALARIRVSSSTVVGMWLLVTVALGLALTSSLGWGSALPDLAFGNLHPGWGFLGWIGLLASGVAYYVVPMFQMTPAYPAPMVRWFAGGVFALLALWSAALWGSASEWGLAATLLFLLLVAAYVYFAGTTLYLQQRRRRRLPDVTLSFWRLGMGCLIAAGALWIARYLPDLEMPAGIEMVIGVLVLPGFAGSIVTGMLHKIIPFLVWFHLYAAAGGGAKVPNMKKILPDGPQQVQLRLHALALALLLFVVFRPGAVVYAAAFVWGMAALLLLRNLMLAVRVYRDNLNLAGAAKAAPGSARP